MINKQIVAKLIMQIYCKNDNKALLYITILHESSLYRIVTLASPLTPITKSTKLKILSVHFPYFSVGNPMP